MNILFQKNKLKMIIIIENLNKQKKQCLILNLKDVITLDSIFSLDLFYHYLIYIERYKEMIRNKKNIISIKM